MELAPLTVLNKRYTIKRTLGEPGPFDILYQGETVESNESVVIREFFPVHLADREEGTTSVDVQDSEKASSLFQSGMEYFQKESEVLSGLDHKALPSGYEIFQANGTVYRARPHQSSMSLRKGLERRDKLSEKAALTIMVPILEALRVAHESGLYHGGVSPDTVRLLKDGNVLLTGFRGAFIQMARQGGELSALVQPGTSAIEQYTPRGNQGPWTDVYAAAATIVQMVTGRELPEASDRLEGNDPLQGIIQDADAFSSPGVREALIDALEVDPSKRLQSAEALASALKESSTRYDGSEQAYAIVPSEDEADSAEASAGTSADDDGDDEEVEVLSTGGGDRPPRSRSRSKRSKKKQSSNTALMVAIPLVLVLLGGGAYFMLSGGSSGSYDEYRSRADSLYQAGQLAEAREAYNQALEVRGDDSFAQQRLQQIEEQMAGGGFDAYISKGDSLMAEADAAFGNNNLSGANDLYTEAMKQYLEAENMRPSDPGLDRRLSRIDNRQEQIFERRAGGGSGESGGGSNVDQFADFLREQGNRLLQSGNEAAALRKFRQAAEYSDDPQLGRMISNLESQVEQQQARTAYQEAYKRGQQQMENEEYTQAKSSFEQAARYRSTSEVQQALSRADSLMQIQREKQNEYQRYRADADVAFQEGNYEAAVELYRRALGAKPGDPYAEEQLEKAKSEYEEIQLAQAKRKKEERRKENMRDGEIYTVVDQEARVDGGLAELHKDVRYPESAVRRGIEGRVYIQAIVNADGSVRSAKVARGLDDAVNDEALRVVRKADFVPAKVDGKPVPARTTVWIQFSLDNQ